MRASSNIITMLLEIIVDARTIFANIANTFDAIMALSFHLINWLPTKTFFENCINVRFANIILSVQVQYRICTYSLQVLYTIFLQKLLTLPLQNPYFLKLILSDCT